RREGAEELGADHGADLVERQVEARAEQGEGGPVQGLQGAEEEEGREADEQDGAAVGVAEGVGGHVLERYRFALRRAARARTGAPSPPQPPPPPRVGGRPAPAARPAPAGRREGRYTLALAASGGARSGRRHRTDTRTTLEVPAVLRGEAAPRLPERALEE